MTVSASDRPFGVLLVCTANVCRSPAAEILLRRALGEQPDVLIGSAGVDARTGRPVDAQVLELLGHPAGGTGARQLTEGLVNDADLVLTMTREQRATLVSRHPAAVRRAFTLLEFADLAEIAVREGADLPPGSAAGLAALRGLAPRLRSRRPVGAADDVDDPHGRGMGEYEDAVGTIRAAVDAISAALVPSQVSR